MLQGDAPSVAKTEDGTVDGELVTPAASLLACELSHHQTLHVRGAVPAVEAEPAFHPDSNREIRSMILAALPIPPMPMMVCMELWGEQSYVHGELKAINSHDVMAHLMNVCCTVVASARNKVCVVTKSRCAAVCTMQQVTAREQARRLVQEQLLSELFGRLDEWQALNDPGGAMQKLPSVEYTYALMGELTRRYVQAYLPDPSKEQDVRFIPLCEVDRQHIVHRKALEFQKAQDVLYGPCLFGNPAALEDMGYTDLLQHSVRRILCSSSS